MAIERASIGEYVIWVLALVGIWLLASPFAYTSVAGAARNNYFGSGIVVFVIAAFLAYDVRRE